MKDRAALCSLVGVVLLLTAAMIGVRSLTAAPTLPSSTKTITIVDQSTQSPVSGAWVVCSAVSDGNGDGQLETYSGFSDSAGIVTVPSSLEGGSELISVARSGYGATTLQFTQTTGESTDVPVELTATSGVSLYWGKLEGAAAGGARIWVWEISAFPRAVADATGKFALALDKTTALEGSATSEVLYQLDWTIDPVTLGSSASPNIIGPAMALALLEIEAQAGAGAPPLDDPVVLYHRSDLANATDSHWSRAEALPGGQFRARVALGGEYAVLLVDGVRWGAASVSVSSSTQTCQAQLREPDSGSVHVSVARASSGDRVTYGEVRVSISKSELSLHPSPPIVTSSVSSLGEAAVGQLPTGSYDIEWIDTAGGGGHSYRPTVVIGEEDSSVELLTGH